METFANGAILGWVTAQLCWSATELALAADSRAGTRPLHCQRMLGGVVTESFS
jgi:hypothetical protein